MSKKVVVRPSAFHTPERKTRLLLAGLPVFAGLLSDDGIVLECNFGPLGSPVDGPTEWIGHAFETGPWWSYDPKSRAAIVAMLDQAKRGQRVSQERLYRRLDGKMGVMVLSLVPLFAPYGKPDAILVIALDVTERRRGHDTAEQVAHDMSHRLRNSFTIMRTLASRADDQTDTRQRLSQRLSRVRAAQRVTYRYLFFDVPAKEVVRTALSGRDDINTHVSDSAMVPSRYTEILLLALGELSMAGHKASVRVERQPQGEQTPETIRFTWTEPKPRAALPKGLASALMVQAIESETNGNVEISNNDAGESSGFIWTLTFPMPHDASSTGDPVLGQTKAS